MDVAAWLRGMGLEQYAPEFRDNDIDGEILKRLTAEDLRELGVASIGHRRRLLDAIAALGAPELSGSPLPDPPPQAGEGRSTRSGDRVGGSAERRQLSVVFW